MHLRKTISLMIVVTLLGIVSVNAQTITVGSSRQEVITQFGEPLGTVRFGVADDVLTYQSIELQLRNGRVTKLIRLNDRPLPSAPASTITGKAAPPAATSVTPAPPAAKNPPIPTNQAAEGSAAVPEKKPLTSASKINGVFLLVVGAVFSIWGTVWLLIRAFRFAVGWGLACLFLPLAQIVFAIMYWDEGGNPFLMTVAGGAALGLGVYILQA